MPGKPESNQGKRPVDESLGPIVPVDIDALKIIDRVGGVVTATGINDLTIQFAGPSDATLTRMRDEGVVLTFRTPKSPNAMTIQVHEIVYPKNPKAVIFIERVRDAEGSREQRVTITKDEPTRSRMLKPRAINK